MHTTKETAVNLSPENQRIYNEQAEHYRLCAEARSLGIPTSLSDPRSPKTVEDLRSAIAAAR